MAVTDKTLREALAEVTGDEAVLASDVNYDLMSPCGDCPFLKTSPFHNGVAKSIPGLLSAINTNSFTHTCHKTDTRKHCDGPVAGQQTNKPIQHCAGALMMLLKTGKGYDLQLPLLQAMEQGRVSDDQVRELTRRAKADKNVFTVRGLVHWYRNKLIAGLTAAEAEELRKARAPAGAAITQETPPKKRAKKIKPIVPKMADVKEPKQ